MPFTADPFSVPSGYGQRDQQQLALAIANLPSFARQLNARSAKIDDYAAQLGEDHPQIIAARSAVEVERAKLTQCDNAVRAAYAKAVDAGQLPNEPIPVERFTDANGLGSTLGVIVTSIVAVTLGVAAVLFAWVEVPLIAIILSIGAVGGAVATAVEALDQLVTGANPVPSNLLSGGVLLFAGVAAFLIFAPKRRAS